MYTLQMEEEQNRKSEKLRLNITVDREIAEQAKNMGFNISAGFEEYLRVFTYKPEGKTSEDIVDAYLSMLFKMTPMLRQYDIGIEIGEITDDGYSKRKKTLVDFNGSKLVMDPYEPSIFKDGKYHQVGEYDHDTRTVTYFTPEDLKYLYEPRKILQNFLNEVKKTADDNANKVQKLNLASRIVDALFSDTQDSSESGIETPSIRRILEDIERVKSVPVADPQREIMA